MPQKGQAGTSRSSADALVPWMYMIYPLEQWLDRYKETFDAWADGGVRGLVIGALKFASRDPKFDLTYRRSEATVATFAPEPGIYRSFGIDPPPQPSLDSAKEKKLHALLEDAASRGWRLLFFDSGDLNRTGSFAQDPFGARLLAARVQDTMRAFPQFHGAVLDGPSESSYELTFHHGGELFEIAPNERPLLEFLGYNVSKMEKGLRRMNDRFHHFTAAEVRYYSSGGTLGGLSLFDVDEDALYWLRSRQSLSDQWNLEIISQMKHLPRKTELGIIVRTAAFSLLASENMYAAKDHFDYVFPKLYFWNRGFDGMYGTIGRWVSTIAEWNPGLSQADCFSIVKSWFGLELPQINSLADLDSNFPSEFFSRVVQSEVRRALEAVGNAEKVVAWISSGRHPHAGDPVTSGDLRQILEASQAAGLKRFIYHPDLNLGAAEWSVISRMCGKPWNGDPNGYWPPDTPKPNTWNGGRTPSQAR